jgi:hypothetical protein
MNSVWTFTTWVTRRGTNRRSSCPSARRSPKHGPTCKAMPTLAAAMVALVTKVSINVATVSTRSAVWDWIPKPRVSTVPLAMMCRLLCSSRFKRLVASPSVVRRASAGTARCPSAPAKRRCWRFAPSLCTTASARSTRTSSSSMSPATTASFATAPSTGSTARAALRRAPPATTATAARPTSAARRPASASGASIGARRLPRVLWRPLRARVHRQELRC